MTLFALYGISFLTAYALDEPIIILDPVNPNVEEGDVITFSGLIKFNERPLSEQPIIIKDARTNTIIVRLLSDQNGQFHFEWNAISGDYVFYAELDSAAAPSSVRSSTYDVIVTSHLEEDSNLNGNLNSEPINSEPAGESNFQSEDLLWLILAILGTGVAYTIYKYKSKKFPRPHVEIKGGLEK